MDSPKPGPGKKATQAKKEAAAADKSPEMAPKSAPMSTAPKSAPKSTAKSSATEAARVRQSTSATSIATPEPKPDTEVDAKETDTTVEVLPEKKGRVPLAGKAVASSSPKLVKTSENSDPVKKVIEDVNNDSDDNNEDQHMVDETAGAGDGGDGGDEEGTNLEEEEEHEMFVGGLDWDAVEEDLKKFIQEEMKNPSWNKKGKGVNVSTALPHWGEKLTRHVNAVTSVLNDELNAKEAYALDDEMLPVMAAQAATESLVLNHLVGWSLRMALKDIDTLKERLQKMSKEAYNIDNHDFQNAMMKHIKEASNKTILRLRERGGLSSEFQEVEFADLFPEIAKMIDEASVTISETDEESEEGETDEEGEEGEADEEGEEGEADEEGEEGETAKDVNRESEPTPLSSEESSEETTSSSSEERSPKRSKSNQED